MKPHGAAAALAPDIYDDDDEFDEAIELSAERAGEIARGLTEVAKEYPNIACPRHLVMIQLPQGILVQNELARWIIRGQGPEHLALLNAMIRPELLEVWVAGSC